MIYVIWITDKKLFFRSDLYCFNRIADLCTKNQAFRARYHYVRCFWFAASLIKALAEHTDTENAIGIRVSVNVFCKHPST